MIWWDTSALVPLYTAERYSTIAVDWAQAQAGQIALSPLHELELTNALRLRIFRNEISLQQAGAALLAHRRDLEAGMLIRQPLLDAAFRHAIRLSESRTTQLGTRSLDLLQVAGALEIGATAFVTFDRRQAELARAEGLRVLG